MMSLITQQLKAKFDALTPVMDERLRRLWAATEARALGRGGISRVSEATGLTPVTIRAGLRELEGQAGGSAQPAAAAGRRVVSGVVGNACASMMQSCSVS